MLTKAILNHKKNMRMVRDNDIEEVRLRASRKIVKIRQQRDKAIKELLEKASELIKGLTIPKKTKKTSKKGVAIKCNQRKSSLFKKRKSRSVIL